MTFDAGQPVLADTPDGIVEATVIHDDETRVEVQWPGLGVTHYMWLADDLVEPRP